jgi:hypothetical protein
MEEMRSCSPLGRLLVMRRYVRPAARVRARACVRRQHTASCGAGPAGCPAARVGLARKVEGQQQLLGASAPGCRSPMKTAMKTNWPSSEASSSGWRSQERKKRCASTSTWYQAGTAGPGGPAPPALASATCSQSSR